MIDRKFNIVSWWYNNKHFWYEKFYINYFLWYKYKEYIDVDWDFKRFEIKDWETWWVWFEIVKNWKSFFKKE